MANLITLLFTAFFLSITLRLFLHRTARLKPWWRIISDHLHDHQLLKIPQFNHHHQPNHLYHRLSIYLTHIDHSHLTTLLSTGPSNTINPNHPLYDHFLGAPLQWTLSDVGHQNSFILKIRTRDKRRVLRPYLHHIHQVSDQIQHSTTKDIHLFVNGTDRGWVSSPFTHPATIETIAMDADIKTKVKSDLESFLRSKQYYNRLGRAWRRSYLLYGPSGTGKSSFVAAMAKILSYDIYDLDINKISSNSDLKLLLLQTTKRSIILVEDFDRYVSNVMSPVSVSGVLNFMDGVVNSCCEERVMVFTMTTKEGVDPSLLRPGRVDVHIHFPMCDFGSFKSLASNHLGLSEHKLFPVVEEMFQIGAKLSPAEIGELMVVNRSSPSRALKSVISALQTTASGGGRRVAPAPESEVVGSPETVMVGCRDGVYEFRKLYELLRGKSTKRSESFDSAT